MNLEGKVLGNRYEIIEKIGSGGMATVYKAKCMVLKRFVAVKILREEYTTDNEFIKRFNTEAESAASLVHPNIVSVYDVGRDGNLYYIVMELVKGKTLKELIVEDGRLGWKWSVQIAKQIAAALETAHRNNIIHRDIKPHNIIITEDGVAKVTDFGIAKAVSNSTITAFGTTLGSVHYFSPEHARGGYTDAKSDLYSLGVVLYEMVTGKVPFDADTPVSVALKHMQENPVEPITLNPAIPQSLNDLIMKSMQKDPSLRYQSATEMIKDLDKIIKNPEGIVEKSGVVTMENKVNEETKVINNIPNEQKNKKKGGKFKKFLEEHKLIKILLIALILLIILIATIGITLVIPNIGNPKDVSLPDFTGKTLDEAIELAKSSKLTVNVQEEKYDVEIEEGKIISQDPKYQANFMIKEGRTVNVVISKGQEIVTVTKLIGKTKDEAMKELKDLGLEYEIEEDYSDDVEAGIIIEQDIKEGEEVLAGSKIILKSSLGIEQVEVPDLTGMTEEEAKNALTAAKLKWKRTNTLKDAEKGKGVVEQSISPKSMVNKGEEITITINEYQETKTGTINVDVASIYGYVEETEEIENPKKDPETGENVLDENGNPVMEKVKTIKTPDEVSISCYLNGEEYETRNGIKANVVNEVFTIKGENTISVKIVVKGNKGTKTKTFDFNLNTEESKKIDKNT